MFNKTAQYYDLIYGFKNYENESEKIRALIKKEHPAAQTILDVGCGTAEHAKYLSEIYKVDGIDLEPDFIEIARKKIPAGRFWVADMSRFALDARYDVVQCLFSSIGYLKKARQVVRALECFKEHLNPNGVIIVEPWFTPEEWRPGVPSMVTVERPDLRICRMSDSDRDGTISLLHFHYLIGRPEGIEYVTEEHELALYTAEEMAKFFKKAGLAARYDPSGIFSGRGLYFARAENKA